MSDIRELYQEVILDHSKRPRNARKVDDFNHQAEGYNALCGDRLTVYARIDGDRLSDIGFIGQGCAICTASASVMTESVKGLTLGEADRLYQNFHTVVTGDPTVERDSSGLGKSAVFAGVAEFPMRVKCATLPWHTLDAAIKSTVAGSSTTDPVSTE